MNERFLIKARSIESEDEWVTGYYYEAHGRHFIGVYSDDIDYEYEIDSETLCQCTTFKDRNHKMIFEGDIVMQHGDEWYVEWLHGKFVYRPLNSDEDAWLLLENTHDFLEVIGNIHDNPKI